MLTLSNTAVAYRGESLRPLRQGFAMPVAELWQFDDLP